MVTFRPIADHLSLSCNEEKPFLVLFYHTPLLKHNYFAFFLSFDAHVMHVEDNTLILTCKYAESPFVDPALLFHFSRVLKQIRVDLAWKMKKQC